MNIKAEAISNEDFNDLRARVTAGLTLVPDSPKLKITLYEPDGYTQRYEDCEIISTLMPELEFKGRRVNGGRAEKITHIAACTLPYIIEKTS